MNFNIIQSQGILSQYVKHFWVMESTGKESPVAERVIPTDNIQLIFHYMNPFRVIRRGNCPPDVQPQSLISGLTNTYSDVSTFEATGMIAVTIYPEAACRFFRFPMSEIADQSVSLSDIYYREVRTLEEQLANDTTLDERIARIEGFLISLMNPLPEYDAELLCESVSLIRKQNGQIAAKHLASHLAVTPRNLERKFARYLGKSPKQFSKTIRFQKVVNDFSSLQNESLTDFAYQNGYFDQSHFIRDFKSFTGFTPKEYRALYGSNHNNPRQ
jgi:AraC-like DNA-binding protein